MSLVIEEELDNHTLNGNAGKYTNLTVEDFGEYHAAQILWKIFPPGLLILGTIGNALSLCVMSRPTMRVTAMGLYLALLATSDLVVNWVGLTRHTIKVYENMDIRKLDAIFCKIHRFILYCSMDFSAWILVAVSAERFIAICMPTRARSFCTVQRAQRVALLLLFISFGQNIHVFWTRGAQYKQAGNVTELVSLCGYPSPAFEYFWGYVLPWIIFGVYAGGPFVTMLILNICIIRGLAQMHNRRVEMRRGSRADTANSKKENAREKASQKYVRSMTIMLVCVSFSFLLLSLPGVLNSILAKAWLTSVNDPLDIARYDLVEAIVIMMNYANHSINFLLYCLTGKRFRQELKEIFCSGFGYKVVKDNTVILVK
ncbi:FMRFamide receptor-like [Lingula anatina]|uniref:FMRFamide receptor-like n=1 Tax=Lingula anatina TaxID=7574 RepID=A0A1S3K7D1_LINAN|nr:FMRFamide receptor-like [Lingula anatina]|eukprot:XP_013418402.1 FMRFamide receptor-like [Lingula anatina]